MLIWKEEFQWSRKEAFKRADVGECTAEIHLENIFGVWNLFSRLNTKCGQIENCFREQNDFDKS